MKNGKFSNTPPLVENDITIEDPLQKSNIFNTFFASLSTVQNSNDPAPHLEQIEGIPLLDSMNTSPFEVAKLIINVKKSHISHINLANSFQINL